MGRLEVDSDILIVISKIHRTGTTQITPRLINLFAVENDDGRSTLVTVERLLELERNNDTPECVLCIHGQCCVPKWVWRNSTFYYKLTISITFTLLF